MIWTPERQELALASLAGWRSVRHANQMASKEHGIDCINLVYEVYIDAEILPREKLPRYDVRVGMGRESDQLKRSLLQCLNAVETDGVAPEFGDILIFKTGRTSAHCGFATALTVWHALARRCVTESSLRGWWHKVDCGIRVIGEGFRTGKPEIVE